MLLALVCVSGSRADDGMWTFDNPPRKLWKERYGFEPTDAWLEHVSRFSLDYIANNAAGPAFLKDHPGTPGHAPLPAAPPAPPPTATTRPAVAGTSATRAASTRSWPPTR